MREKRPFLPPHLCSPSLLSHCPCMHASAVPGVAPFPAASTELQHVACGDVYFSEEVQIWSVYTNALNWVSVSVPAS